MHHFLVAIPYHQVGKASEHFLFVKAEDRGPSLFETISAINAHPEAELLWQSFEKLKDVCSSRGTHIQKVWDDLQDNKTSECLYMPGFDGLWSMTKIQVAEQSSHSTNAHTSEHEILRLKKKVTNLQSLAKTHAWNSSFCIGCGHEHDELHKEDCLLKAEVFHG